MFQLRLLMLLLTPFNATNVNAFQPYNIINSSTIPVVVLHGVASSAGKMNMFSSWISDTFNRTVFNIEIGDGESTSLYTSLPEQLIMLCSTLYSMKELESGFDFIGMSQGGLLARGYVEQCNKFPVHNLITLVSPHGGVKNGLTLNMYSKFFQEHFSIAGYWRDPTQLAIYLEKCNYLPLLNNERITADSETQKNNMVTLDNFVLVWSSQDTTVTPPESAKFSFYDEDYNIISIRDTELYKEDLLGLRYLDENNRFNEYETNCSHVEHRDPVCYEQMYDILKNYL